VAERYLAFDLGASSGRAILGELGDDDKLAVSETQRFPNGMVNVDGHLHWDSKRLLDDLHNGMRACAKHGDPVSIGIDTWGVDFALLDNGGSIVNLPYAYRDRRTEGAVEGFASRMPLEHLYELTGIQILPFNTLFQLYSMVRDKAPELDSASTLLMMADLFNYHLTGIKASEFTIATTSHIYSPKKRRWDEEIINALGISQQIFQEIIQPGNTIGELTRETQAKTGMGNVSVAAVACHDTGSAVAAVPAEGNDFAYISSGTWSLMGIESRTPVINRKTLEYNITNEGGVSDTYRVLKNITGLWLLQECIKAWSSEKVYTYNELIKLAEAVESLKTVIDPDWKGFLSPSSMPDAIAEYCRATEQEAPKNHGEYVRVILESLALAYRYTIAQLEDASGKGINRIYIVGGGARNTLLSQLAADATGRRVYAGPAEATAIGNLMVQAMARGRIRDLTQLREIVRGSIDVELYEPRESQPWDEAYLRFQELKKKKVI
jgi:rhamnulokinase